MAPERYQSDSSDASSLGKPLRFEFSGKTAKNRFLKAAMTERISSWDPKDEKARGIPSKNLINVYKRWGEGGYGQILTGNIMIEYDQLEAMGNPIIPPDAEFSGPRFEAFKELATAAKAHGSLVVGQVSHPGRQCESRIQKDPISASDVQLEVGAMVKTLETVDGVGIARPACQEPHLPNDILAGKVTRAIKMKLDENNFGLTNMAAGTQIRQVGKDQEPVDFSVQGNVDGFMKDMEAWGKKMGEDKEMKEFGYIDLSQVAKPYGVASR